MDDGTPRGIRYPVLSFTTIASGARSYSIEGCKKPLNREIQGFSIFQVFDQAASILLRFCSTLFR
jgi:hypothetical protein